MAKRIRIEPRTTGSYKISELNPNPGGECLCSPYGHSPDCRGPYIVFHRAHVTTSGRLVIPVICAGTVKAFLLHVEAGGEVGQVGSARGEDAAFDGGQPTDPPGLPALRLRYQTLASTVPLSELPSWDEWLETQKNGEDGLYSSPNSASTRNLDTTGIDPDALDLMSAMGGQAAS